MTERPTAIRLAAVSLLFFVIATPPAIARQAWNETTGRDLRNFAPNRTVDYRHMRLALDIPDMNTPRLEGNVQLTFEPIGRDVRTLSLDARSMEIRNVKLADQNAPLTWSYDDEELTVEFDPPLPVGQEATLEVGYTVFDPPQGLIWTPESDAWPDRPAQLHTQGQPESNSWWFPCHDFPNERLTTELIVAVPAGYTVSSNGRLVAETPAGRQTQFHWLQDKEHVNYLVTLVVGKFDVVDVAPAGSDIPMPVYVPPGQGPMVEQTYRNTAPMMDLFERLFDEPYPWDRYAQVIVWNFGAGGMENTSATTMYDTAVFDRIALQDDDLDGLISHELAHQWFGDLITCNTWAHIWLNEGWATYSTHLWFEERDGRQNGYLARLHSTMRGLASRDNLVDGGPIHQPMVSDVYEHPWDVFRRTANPYPKGASILHMLRSMLGDDLFFEGVAAYVDRHRNTTVETDDFRAVMEDVSGLSLERFFKQWCLRPGTPDVHVDLAWDEASDELRISVEQTQLIDEANPAFVFDLPIEIIPRDDGASSTPNDPISVTIPVNARRHERSIKLAGRPAMVLVDPDLSVLMSVEVDQPASWLHNQLFTTRSVASRLDAARMLTNHPGPTTVDVLARSLVSPGENERVRSAAARSLGDLLAWDALARSLDSGVGDPRVRLDVIRALGAATTVDVADALARHASDEESSYACREAALEALGRVGTDDHLGVLLDGLAAESQHDRVRRGALAGLAALDHPDGLAAAIPFTRPGNLNRLRPRAIDAVAALSHHDRERAFEAIAPLLQDRESRTVRAAGAALVEIAHEDGLDALARLATSTRDRVMRDRAERWRDELAASLDDADSIRRQRQDVERLRRELEELRERMEMNKY